MALTDEGREFLESAQPALAGLQRAMQMARRAKEDIAGPLRIVGPRSTFLPVLWPVLDEFCRLHPQVQPDVQLDDRIGNWVEDRHPSTGKILPWYVKIGDGVVDHEVVPALAVSRLVGSPAYELSTKELAAAEAKGRRLHRIR